MHLNNFSIVPKLRAEKRVRPRSLGEWVGTGLIRFGERIGGRNRTAEAHREMNVLLATDIELTRRGSGGETYRGPWC